LLKIHRKHIQRKRKYIIKNRKGIKSLFLFYYFFLNILVKVIKKERVNNMLFNAVVESNVNPLQKLAVLEEKYNIIFEGMKLVAKMYESDDFSILEETDLSVIQDKAEDFIEDAHKFIDEAKKKKDAQLNKAQAFFLVSLGLSLTTMLLPFAGTTGLIISIITLVGSLITLLLGYFKVMKADKEFRKMRDIKSDLIKIKGKTTNQKIKDKIDNLIERIDNEIK